MKSKNKVILMILDGWGIGKPGPQNAIDVANTPNMDSYMKDYSFVELGASGEDVGLPEGQMGNSEVGHLNLGAGRVVDQDLVRINKAIKDGSFFKNQTLVEAFKYAEKKGVKVHMMGLLSDGGVHSMNSHLYALLKMSDQYDLTQVFVHAFMDGRDTDPKSGKGYIQDLIEELRKYDNASLATICGRYYAMDRDKRWERIKLAYDLLVESKGESADEAVSAVEKSYQEGVTDEFIKPIVIDNNAKIEEGDVVICFNYRTDRLRQMTLALTQQDMPEHELKTIPLRYLTMTRYDEDFKNIDVIYDKENIKNTIGEIISKSGLKQLRIAETEKYAHVTFFFSGGREEPFENEDRRMIDSPKVATYDLKPEMSALDITSELKDDLKKAEHDFICLNFANGDMVGHTGVFDAALKALETLDQCVGEIVEEAKKQGYVIFITADHGNVEFEKNEDGTPNTAHTTNKVPFIMIGTDNFHLKTNGILADVAPTVLKVMGVDAPSDMTGKSMV
ncbi:2,3-bisphosphoglycerate-independent phosphoglycerate mutase [Candidatus Peregrinibacteria bacterium]|nr:2,3-bisphosphoglycerate-independent phosphoglycerate mutase [Candidatus Peregrinibacteria bacterium]